MSEEPTLSSVLDFGQGDDDTVLELFNGLNSMLNGYYTLENYGDKWWEAMNQDIWFDAAMQEEWNKVDWETVLASIEMMSKLMIGTYVKFGKFTDGLNVIGDIGKGHRPQRKKNESTL